MQLYNTLTQKLDEVPVPDNQPVKMYTCGLTVYSAPHIGNWVGYIYWDVLVRTLNYRGVQVERTQNYTDVGHLVSDDDSGEDKMQSGADREGITAWDVAKKYIAVAEHEAYDLLQLLPPTHVIRATDTIDEQIAFAQALDAKGYLYKIDGDGMYFDTAKLTDYGKLARLDIAGLAGGTRVSVEGKRSITDFAVWKFSPTDKKRDMEWESPWGIGFPGWHLECSVIARETLGDHINIHTGGIDHIPVHHTNEIAQTEALTGTIFSDVWVHNNHLKVDGGKMAKSLGNTYTLDDITEKGFSIDAFKIFVLSKHYRSEGNFTWENMELAQQRLAALEQMADLQFQPIERDQWIGEDALETLVLQNLENDLNTAVALNNLSGFANKAETELIGHYERKSFISLLEGIDAVLGLSLSSRVDITDTQKQQIADRETARQNQQWDTSDAIRDELQKQGIGVHDTPAGTIWHRLRR